MGSKGTGEYTMFRLFFFSYPIYFPLLVILAILSFRCIRQNDENPSFFFVLALNVFAVLSTASTFAMMFSGGHPVKQMSQGNWQAWSAWLNFYPIPFLGLMVCVFIAFVFVFIYLVRLCRDKTTNKTLAVNLFVYAVFTLIHCCVAFNWLLMFMPDA